MGQGPDSVIGTAVRQALDPVAIEAIGVEQRRDSAGEDAPHVVATLPTGTLDLIDTAGRASVAVRSLPPIRSSRSP